MSKQPPYASAAILVGFFPTIIQISRKPRHWKLPSTIARPQSSLDYNVYTRQTIEIERYHTCLFNSSPVQTKL